MNPNYQKMMKQVQKMQADMAKAQEDLANEIVEASAGGGMVTVQVTGAIEMKSIKIDPAAVDPEDVEMLEDMITGRHQRGAALGPGAGQQEAGRHHRRVSTSPVCPSSASRACPGPITYQHVAACSAPPSRSSSTSSASSPA